jgi:hypothetical protein
MIDTKRAFSPRFIRNAILIALISVMTSTCFATWVCCEGEDWLHWNAQTRNVYVRAYTEGNLQGYNRGCGEGIISLSPKINGQTFIDSSKKCAAKAPITSLASTNFAEQITRFYELYPHQRFLRISDILLGLYAGKSLEKIHLSFPQN